MQQQVYQDEFDVLTQVFEKGCTDCEFSVRAQPDGDLPLANPHAGILDSDQSPIDVVTRRTRALLTFLADGSLTGDLSDAKRRLNKLNPSSDRRFAKMTAGARTEESFAEVAALRDQIALQNPLMDFDTLIFSRYTPIRGHIAFHDGIYLLPGGGLYMLTGLQSGETRIVDLLDGVRFTNGPYAGSLISDFPGTVRDFDLSYDGKRIVFSWIPYPLPASYDKDYRNNIRANPDEERKLKILTINVDGTDLRQLTSGPHNDAEPAWLPNGRIVFISDRINITVRCSKKDPSTRGVLFSMNADGSDQIRISFHETEERYPAVDNNGMIVYTRWDYIDRDFNAAHHLWTCFPDGRDPRAPHGNYPAPYTCTNSCEDGRNDRPWAEVQFTPIPGSHKLAAIATNHHGFEVGPPIIIDPNIPDDGKVSQVTVLRSECPFPSESGSYGGRGMFTVKDREHVNGKPHCKYFSPWPLSEEFFLVSARMSGGVMGLYLIDVFGNKTLVTDCATPSGGEILRARPCRARTRPAVVPTRTWQGERWGTEGHQQATISVVNVYDSDFSWPADVKVKSLRIIQLLQRPTKYYGYDEPKIGWSSGGIARASLGTVPVEDDGSVYFKAPVEKSIMFQALDENGIAVATMRSLTYVHPGEDLSCAGCHEDKWKATPPPSTTPAALRRPPSEIHPEIEGSLPFSFGRLVRPVFNNVCLPCHRQEQKGIQKFYYGIEPNYPDYDNPSRLSEYAHFYDASGAQHGVGPYGGYRSTVKGFGTYGSIMGKTLLKSHRDRVSQEELARVFLWLDLNSMELGSYTQNEDDIQAQKAGTRLVWPGDITPWNPTGMEILTQDASPPGPVGDVYVAGFPFSSFRIAWSPADDAESGVLSYRVKRDSTVLGIVPHPYLTDLFPPEDSADYTVTAINRMGLESEPVTVTLHRNSEPSNSAWKGRSPGPSRFAVFDGKLNISSGVLTLQIDIPSSNGKREASISIGILNARGRSVLRATRTLTAGQRHRLTLNTRDAGGKLSPGVYYVKISGPNGAHWIGRVLPLSGLSVVN